MQNKFEFLFNFDEYYTNKFKETTSFEGIELLHWSFMGDKFIFEIEHILSCNPEHINIENKFGDTPLILSANNCSSKIFKYLFNFPNVNIFHTNSIGNIFENFLFSKINNENIEDSYDSALEGIKLIPDYANNSYEICLEINKKMPNFYQKKYQNQNNLLFQTLSYNPSALTNDKLKGFLLFLLEQENDFLTEKDYLGNNLMFILLQKHNEDVLSFFNDNGGKKLLKDMFLEKNNNNETVLFSLFANQTLKSSLLVPMPNINTNILQYFSYGMLDILEEFLDLDNNREIIKSKDNSERTVIDYLKSYKELIEEIQSSPEIKRLYQANHIDFLEGYLRYTIRFLSKYIN